MKFRFVLEMDTVKKRVLVYDGAEMPPGKIKLPAPRKEAHEINMEHGGVDDLMSNLQGAMGLWCRCEQDDWADLLMHRVEHDFECK
jgi:hypothetical protein